VNFKNKMLKSNSGFIKKGVFLALILSACIITSSLIHEATTFMKKLFKL